MAGADGVAHPGGQRRGLQRTGDTKGGVAQSSASKRPWPDPGPNSLAAGGNTPVSFLQKNIKMLHSPRYKTLATGNLSTEVIWQLPPRGVRARGVMFLAHAGMRTAGCFWPKSAACKACMGCPIEMNITIHCLIRGYAVVAVSSKPVPRPMHQGWHNKWGGLYPPEDNDSKRPPNWMYVRDALDYVLALEGLDELPLYAFGGSSGGSFVLSLPIVLPGRFRAIINQLGLAQAGVLRGYGKGLQEGRFKVPYPPALFMPMVRDTKTTQDMRKIAAELREQGTRVDEEPIYPLVLTPLHTAQRCGGMLSENQSRLVYDIYRAGRFLDAYGYFTASWRDFMKYWGLFWEVADVTRPGIYNELIRQGPCSLGDIISEVYGYHRVTSEKTTLILDWIEGLEDAMQ